MTISIRTAWILLLAGLTIAALPDLSLGVTGDEFVNETAVRLGQGTSAFVNILAAAAAMVVVIALYIAYKISQYRRRRDIEEYVGRASAYQEEVKKARSARQQKNQGRGGNRTQRMR